MNDHSASVPADYLKDALYVTRRQMMAIAHELRGSHPSPPTEVADRITLAVDALSGAAGPKAKNTMFLAENIDILAQRVLELAGRINGPNPPSVYQVARDLKRAFSQTEPMVRVTPGWHRYFADVDVIGLRSALYFLEHSWQNDVSDYVLSKILEQEHWDYPQRADVDAAAIREALAAKRSDPSEPVIEVKRGWFEELKRAQPDELRSALDLLAKPSSEPPGSCSRFIRMALDAYIVRDRSAIEARLAWLNDPLHYGRMEGSDDDEIPF
jgi:hypothetical protein